MSDTSTLEALAVSASEEYRALVKTLAEGNTVDPSRISHVLVLAGKTPADLRRHVGTLQDRLRWAEALVPQDMGDEVAALKADESKALEQAEKAEAKARAADAKLREARSLLSQITCRIRDSENSALAASRDAVNKLRESSDPEIHSRLRRLHADNAQLNSRVKQARDDLAAARRRLAKVERLPVGRDEWGNPCSPGVKPMLVLDANEKVAAAESVLASAESNKARWLEQTEALEAQRLDPFAMKFD